MEEFKLRIIVDADACPKPVLQHTVETGAKYGIPVITVASFNHNIISSRHITVESGSQEADLKIINITDCGDIIITQDWGLAAIVLSKKALALSPAGIEYEAERMTFMLEEREIKAKFRRNGGRTKGPKKRATGDDIRFLSTLEKIVLREIQRKDF
ncbi:MAG: DUF188 domain-containing protein [Synergistaceae bacterium]|jgi:hypothetical protein|nr:DUF188 domain-containing protein [Synergistaceae bacterium]MDD5420741.1 DUF188 domain-containing protein [Synergistaceae bacterium]